MSQMKKILGLLLITFCIASCKTESQKSNSTAVSKDTITTASGLKYIFLKKGNGQKIEEGSKVQISSDLYLNDADTVFWSTSTAKDSMFSFVHKKTRLIKGFSELHDYLSEGDEVTAIIPYDLAYGENRRGTIPAKSTLIYSPLTVKYVSKPKLMMNDTLLSIAKQKGVDTAIQFYNNASDAVFHTEVSFMSSFLVDLEKDSLLTGMERFAQLLGDKATEPSAKQTCFYYQVRALELQQKYDKALKVIEPLTKQDQNQQYWQNYSRTIQNRMKRKK